MPNEERGRLDAAIDRAVRGMMQVDPRAGLRHRVTARLSTPAPRGAWLVPAMGTAAVAIALVLFWSSTWIPRPQPVVPTEIASARPSSAPSAGASQPPSPQVGRATASVERPRRTPGVIFDQGRGRISAASLGRPIQVDPSVSPAHLDQVVATDDMVASPPTIAIAPIVLQPITITPLTVSALPIRK